MTKQLCVRNLRIAISAALLIGLFACNKKNIFTSEAEGTDARNMQVVRLSKETMTLRPGQSAVLLPYFFPAAENPKQGYSWKSDHPDIADITINEDFSATVTAKLTGTSRITIHNQEGALMASCEVTVSEHPTPAVQMSIQQATMLVGDELTINPVIEPPAANPEQFFDWQVDDTTLIAKLVKSDFSVQLTAKRVGQALITLVNRQNNEVVASATIQVEEELVAGTLVHPIQISLGAATNVPAEWNPLPAASAGTSLPDLLDKAGNSTGVSVSIIEKFNGSNTDGAKVTNTILDMPASVSGSSFYGNSFGAFNGIIVERSVLLIAGLNKDVKYDFCFFGSRAASDNRDTKFIVEGQNNGSASINTASNTDKVACVDGIYPNADGTISITITAGENNSNATGFYYMGAMRIASSD